MICTKCRSSDTLVVSTRAIGFETRRRHCCKACGERFTSRQFPEQVFQAVPESNVQRRLAAMARGIELRFRSAENRRKVIDLAASGWKPTAIAHEVGLSDNRVRHIIRKHLQ